VPAFQTWIGFRDVFNAIIKKDKSFTEYGGYSSLGNGKGNMKNNTLNLKPLCNKYYEEINFRGQ
jgi:hypothetical protein